MKYKKQIIGMVSKIRSEQLIKMIYGFVRAIYREDEKGGAA